MLVYGAVKNRRMACSGAPSSITGIGLGPRSVALLGGMPRRHGAPVWPRSEDALSRDGIRQYVLGLSRILGGNGYRESENEGRAVAQLTVDTNVSAVGIHNVAGDRQSQPGAT